MMSRPSQSTQVETQGSHLPLRLASMLPCVASVPALAPLRMKVAMGGIHCPLTIPHQRLALSPSLDRL